MMKVVSVMVVGDFFGRPEQPIATGSLTSRVE